MSILQWYLLLYLLIILIVDHTSFFDEVPFLHKLIVKHSVLLHPLRCSLCATFWITIIFVLVGLSPWFLLLPFVSKFISSLLARLFDLLSRV